MKMSYLWQYRWLLLRWGLFVFVLVGLGWALYAWLPPQPRWVVYGPLDSLGLAPDGKTIRTRTGGSGNAAIWFNGGGGGGRRMRLSRWAFPSSHSGPVHFWDVDSGREVRRFVDEVSSVDGVTFSSDGRRLYAVAWHTGEKPVAHLHHADLDTGRESHAAIETHSPGWAIHLSPGGKLLLLERAVHGMVWDFMHVDGILEPAREPQPSFFLIYDAQSLRLVSREDAAGWQWRWSPDGEALLLYAAHDTGKATLRRITAQGETITLFDGAGHWRGVTPDGKTLLTDWPAVAEGDDPGPSLLLWDTFTGKRQGEIPRFLRKYSPVASPFVGNGRTLVIAQDGPPGPAMAVVWHLDRNAPLDKVSLEDRRILVSSESNVFALFRSPWRTELTLYRSQPLAELWQRNLGVVPLREVEFLAGTNRLVVESGHETARLEVVDVETGKTCFEVAVVDQHRLMLRGRFLAVEETVAIAAEPRGWFKEMVDKCFAALLRDLPARADFETITRVFDTQTGEQLGRLELPGASVADLSPDGRSIFMQEEDNDGNGGSLSCYDVPPRAYWLWIIGIPLAVGVLLIALRAGGVWVWRRRVARKLAADAARREQGVPP